LYRFVLKDLRKGEQHAGMDKRRNIVPVRNVKRAKAHNLLLPFSFLEMHNSV
jgi:hypothetical protein